MKIAALTCIAASLLFTACDSDLNLSLTTYTIGGTVSGLSGSGLVLQNLSGENESISLAISSNGSFAFAPRIANGTAYAVTIRSQPVNPAQICSVSNGSGTLMGSDVTNVMISCEQSARFAYVANKLSNNISAYAVNSASGTLTAIAGSPFVSTGSGPESVSVGPGGNFLYVTNSASNDLSVFSIASGTGLLNPVATVPTGDAPNGIAVDPTGNYLYVSNYSSNDVSAYAIAASTGTLTEVPGSPFPVGIAPTSLKTDPGGKFLYVANYGSGNVSVLLIDSANGSLSAVAGSPFAAGRGPISIAIDGTGSFAYVANQVGATISEYSIDSSTGALTAVPASPVVTQSAPTSLVIDPSGGSLIVADVTQANEVASFSVDDAGVLTLSGMTQTGTSPVDVAIDPSGEFAYVVCTSTNNVFVYTINAGLLTPAAQLSVPAGTGPQSIAIN